MREAPAEAGPKSRLAPARGCGVTDNPQFTVLPTCHCEEPRDAAISLYRYLLNEIATLPLAMTT